MDLEDIGLLQRFLQAAVPDINSVVQMAASSPGEHAYLEEAWRAVQGRPDLDALLAAVEIPANAEALDNAGLSGVELRYKLAGVQNARRRFREDGTPLMKFRWGRRLLLRIDVILKSLISVLGLGEALSEFKETLELDLEEMEEDAA